MFFMQKTAYEIRISDWSSDVCSSDLVCFADGGDDRFLVGEIAIVLPDSDTRSTGDLGHSGPPSTKSVLAVSRSCRRRSADRIVRRFSIILSLVVNVPTCNRCCGAIKSRSEEPTSELQSLMRISYAVFC